jgi:hypothetical protein
MAGFKLRVTFQDQCGPCKEPIDIQYIDVPDLPEWAVGYDGMIVDLTPLLYLEKEVSSLCADGQTRTTHTKIVEAKIVEDRKTRWLQSKQ